ncbi:hypothetical protein NLV76_02070 [Bacillus halotolerans]|nr:hypothetical protein [Bacillus halotolerans]UTL73090.1 hypothetical protein NLV76_02070 [Bacillus halotolerans]
MNTSAGSTSRSKSAATESSLSEIEVQLAQLSQVQDAAVTAVKDKGGNTAIAAYVTPETADIEALKSALKETLPDYMIPAFWVTLNEPSGYRKRQSRPQSTAGAGHRSRKRRIQSAVH